MIYEKKQVNIGTDNIPNYVNDFENRVDTGFKAINTESKLYPQSGSNPNGNWVKYEDGTMICWHTMNIAYKASTYLESRWNYPQDFIGNVVPQVTPDASLAQSWYMDLVGRGTPSSTSSLIRVGSSHASFVSGDTYTAYLTAFGRWK